MQSSQPPQDAPGIDGPDYVSLVIEWDDDVPTLVRAAAPDSAPARHHSILPVLSALAAIGLATWGIRHFRHAI